MSDEGGASVRAAVWSCQGQSMSETAATVARQAALLEADLEEQQSMADRMDTGVIAKRSRPRSHVAETEDRLKTARLNVAMIALHRRCTVRPMGDAYTEHLNAVHGEDAVAVVTLLFPEGLI